MSQKGAAASMRTSAWEQPSPSPMRLDTRESFFNLTDVVYFKKKSSV